jgi:hypothetical protein
MQAFIYKFTLHGVLTYTNMKRFTLNVYGSVTELAVCVFMSVCLDAIHLHHTQNIRACPAQWVWELLPRGKAAGT